MRHQHQKEFWWNCSGYPQCFMTAGDFKGEPNYLTKEQMEEAYFLGQLQYLKKEIKDLKAQILIRFIQKKGGLNTLSEHHRFLYDKLVEPIRASYSFAQCSRCTRVTCIDDMLSHNDQWYVCEGAFRCV
jgi:hypothetical protein